MFELSITFLFALILPAAAFAGGAYLIFRGLRRGDGAPSAAGALSCADAFHSQITGCQCAYSKTVIERYRRGHDPWEIIYKMERKAPFMVGKTPVNPENADIQVSAPRRFTGYLKPGAGMLNELNANIRHVRAMADFTGEVASTEFIDDPVITAVLGLPGAADKLKPHMGDALRISEFSLPVGAEVTVFQDPAVPPARDGALRGSAEYPLIVSDQPSVRINSPMREKSFFSLVLGAALVAVSFFLLVALFLF